MRYPDPPSGTEELLPQVLGVHPQPSAPLGISTTAESFLTQGHPTPGQPVPVTEGVKAWNSRPLWGPLGWVIHLLDGCRGDCITAGLFPLLDPALFPSMSFYPRNRP